LQPLRQHRQRIGRVALGNLAEGATRSLLPHEKF
jgi:16S rRNA U516 pseudouridylate synthase RsuA-like enzyme